MFIRNEAMPMASNEVIVFCQLIDHDVSSVTESAHKAESGLDVLRSTRLRVTLNLVSEELLNFLSVQRSHLGFSKLILVDNRREAVHGVDQIIDVYAFESIVSMAGSANDDAMSDVLGEGDDDDE